ncbi:MAG: biopolymer transporter ExbD [Marinoscillum sp.]
MKIKNRKVQEINTGSMADIAFLLLIFFLVSTTILQQKGVSLNLPEAPEDETSFRRITDRNLFKIQINSNNQYLIEDQVRENLDGLRADLIEFIQNNGIDPELSDSPERATISLKTNRGTDYKHFIEALDEIKEAYFEIYASRLGMTTEEYRSLDLNDTREYQLYEQGKEGVPMNISIAEPDQTNS